VGTGVELVVDGAPDVWPLDGSRMRQALGNLLSNARQSAPAARAPRATVAGRDGSRVFEVRDFGPGLPHGSEDRIFEPFFTTRASGTGLGLAVARRVAEMHGGAITASNHPEGGAVFRILIPARS
jgi:signal transduction histidine kinase